MSGHGTSHNDHHGHDGAGDEIAYGKVIAVGAISLAIFAVSTWWAATILTRETKRYEDANGVVYHPKKVEKEEIGIVDQVPFVIDTRLHRWRAEHAAKLNGYGWVDRDRGVAHVPIEQAMDAIANGAQPAGAPR